MSAAHVVVLLVAVGESGDPSTRALETTAREALEGEAVVVVREGEVDDASALRVEQALSAEVVVVVRWEDPEHRKVLLHARRGASSSWIDRSLAFGPEDPPEERGRMVGFEIAALVPRTGAPESEAPPEAHARDEANPPEPSGARFGLDALATANAGEAGGLGADLSGRWAPGGRRLALRLVAGARFGTLDDSRADLTTLRFGGGVVATFAESGGRRPLRAGARVDILALRHGVSRAGESGSRLLGAADLLVEGAWTFAPSFALVGAAGGEVAFGSTRLVVGDERVATVGPLRLVFELGVRWEL